MVRRIDESDKNRKSVKESRIGRTKEVKVLQGNWGYGWDDLCEYDKYDNGECKNDLKAYRENDPSASYRVIFRRVPNKDYVPTESVKKKNSKSLKENLDGVDGYAVDIHDMGKGYHHLLLFTDEDTAESAYNGLAECEEYADRGVDDDGYEYDEYALDDGINQISGMADEIVNEVDMRREVDRNDIWTAADDTRYQIIGSVDLWIYW